MSIIKPPVPATWIRKTQKSPAGKKALYPWRMTVHCWHGSSPAPAKWECGPGGRESPDRLLFLLELPALLVAEQELHLIITKDTTEPL